MEQKLERELFAIPRDTDFLDKRELRNQTGRSVDEFGDVIVKELVDNSLDAAETAGKPPMVAISREDGCIVVRDNGPGMSRELVRKIQDFDLRVSDKSAYRSPTRGLQGNAWKTLLGIPHALGVNKPVVIESQGIRHSIRAGEDLGRAVLVHEVEAMETDPDLGTTVKVPLPDDMEVDIRGWARRFALVNPHAVIHYLDEDDQEDDDDLDDEGMVANERPERSWNSYKPTVDLETWRKPLPTDPTSPHWYDTAAFTKLVHAHIRTAESGGVNKPHGEFIRSFAGLSSTAKANKIRTAMPDNIRYLSDFRDCPDEIGHLLTEMQAEARLPKAKELGEVGEDHFRRCFEEWYGVERFWYKRVRIEGITPYILEVAVAETSWNAGDGFHAVNYSPTFGDPLAKMVFATDDIYSMGAESFLTRMEAWPTPWTRTMRAAVVHAICPAVEFLDKGKSTIDTEDE